jgi:hypothetical protein
MLLVIGSILALAGGASTPPPPHVIVPGLQLVQLKSSELKDSSFYLSRGLSLIKKGDTTRFFSVNTHFVGNTSHLLFAFDAGRQPRSPVKVPTSVSRQFCFYLVRRQRNRAFVSNRIDNRVTTVFIAMAR